jgi:hypothetical protein
MKSEYPVQYWRIRDSNSVDIAYYNPDSFREYNNRQDKINPIGDSRKEICRDPAKFLDSIEYFSCSECKGVISKKNSKFMTMLRLTEQFITGDVFPHLTRG